jgi:hypothetical protein
MRRSGNEEKQLETNRCAERAILRPPSILYNEVQGAKELN